MAKIKYSNDVEKTEPQKRRERQFTAVEFHHDLYKLEIATLKKNVGVDGKGHKPTWEDYEHVHYFHTIDSDGRKQKRSVSVAGHFHEMTVVEDPDGGPPMVSCGPAMHEVRRRDDEGRQYREALPIAYDKHSHNVTYMRSDKVLMRQTNADATNIAAAEHNKTAAISGIQG